MYTYTYMGKQGHIILSTQRFNLQSMTQLNSTIQFSSVNRTTVQPRRYKNKK